MPFMDRESFIALLNSLGDADDATVLANARTLHARMQDAGVSWDALLIPAPGSEPVEPEEDGEDWREPTPPTEFMPSEDDTADAALIDRMLAEYSLSEEARRELLDLKADIAAGEFTRQDSKYIRNLASRLSTRKKAG